MIIGIIGLHLIRIEFSGIPKLDQLNKNINTNTFNAILTLLIIFIIIKSLPPILSWFIIDGKKEVMFNFKNELRNTSKIEIPTKKDPKYKLLCKLSFEGLNKFNLFFTKHN